MKSEYRFKQLDFCEEKNLREKLTFQYVEGNFKEYEREILTFFSMMKMVSGYMFMIR